MTKIRRFKANHFLNLWLQLVEIPVFSPPTRGWPAREMGIGRPRTVFPAHAGMARFCGCVCGRRVGFPRPRGDGPHWDMQSGPPISFSPPTRGWPDLGTIFTTLGTVFPAHAGMARTQSRTSCWRRRFPRPRGDGPQVGVRNAVQPSFSPPTRGWPGSRSGPPTAAAVFPAHAGMARLCRLSRWGR